MNAPSISVIVPIYRVQDYIAECLQSLLDQTIDDFEVVCIDDGSPDESLAVAKSLVGQDERFRFIEQANAGLSAARNRGIAESRGEYLVFLDSDDCYLPEALELLLLAARANDLDYLDFTAHAFYESDEARRVCNEDFFEQRSDIEGVLSGPDLFVEYVKRDEYYCPACFHFFKRELLERANLRFKEGIIHEDELFSPLLIAHAKRAGFLNLPLYLRRVRADSIMTAKRGLRNVDSLLVVTRELENWLRMRVEARAVSGEFACAMAARIAFLRAIMVSDASSIASDELAAFEANLADELRIDFELYVKGGFLIREQIDSKINRLYRKARMRLAR